MAEEKVLDEELEEENETEWTKQADADVKSRDPKHIIIETVKGVIADYKEQMQNSNDEMLLKGFADESKTEEECVNYVMNNLVKKQIFGGRDSLMYPYIHDYYVDDLKEDLVKDNWSSQIRGGGSGQQVRVQKPTQKDIMEAYDALDNEKKNEIYQQQLKRAEEEAYKKAQAKIKADEEKAKEKAKLKAEAEKQKKEEEKKAKEEALKSGAAEQMSLFDF